MCACMLVCFYCHCTLQIHVHLIDHVLLYGTGRESDLYADWDALRGSKGVFNS
jgi:hypothetical protein